MTISEVKKTICTIFIVPTLHVPKDALRDNGFINGFIKDAISEEEYEDCVFLLFKPEDLDKFRVFLDEEYQRTKDVISDYDYDGGFVVVVYRLNPKYSTDFNLVKQGKYSKTSKDFQNEFPKVVKLMKNGLHKDELSLQYRVFKRTEDLVKFWEDKFDVTFPDEQEVWHGWDEEKETLTKTTLDFYETLI